MIDLFNNNIIAFQYSVPTHSSTVFDYYCSLRTAINVTPSHSIPSDDNRPITIEGNIAEVFNTLLSYFFVIYIIKHSQTFSNLNNYH